MWKVWLIAGLFLLGTGCGHTGLPVIAVNEETEEDIPLSEVATEVVAVALGEMPDRPLGAFFSVCRDEKNIFVREIGSIRRFDRKGRFLNAIGTAGHGPGEYSYLAGFCLDSLRQRVYALTSEGVICYDYDGSIVAQYEGVSGLSSDIGFAYGQLYVLKEMLGEKGSREGEFINRTILYRFDRDMIMTDSAEVQSVRLNSLQGALSVKNFPFSAVEGEMYFYKPVLLKTGYLPDTLYRLTDRGPVPHWRLNFMAVAGTESQRIMITNLCRSKRFVFCEFLNKNRESRFCYDLELKQGYTTSGRYADDLTHWGKADLRPLDMEGGWMYFVKEGYELEGKWPGITEESNPVVFFVKLKE